MRIFRAIFSTAAIVFLLSAIGLEAKADNVAAYRNETTNYSVYIEDNAALLSDYDRERLKEDMIPVTKYGNATFLTTDDNTSSAAGYAKEYNNTKFGTASSTVFFIDMRNREIYIFSNGTIYNSVTNSKARSITDNVYKYASDGDYYSCASKAFSQIYKVAGGQKIAEPMKYIGNALFAMMLALVINFFIVSSSSKAQKVDNSVLASNSMRRFNATNFQSVKGSLTKRYNPRSSDSGGSSGGGSSGGGGGGGGGGGHSF